jgi:hypothetical protein
VFVNMTGVRAPRPSSRHDRAAGTNVTVSSAAAIRPGLRGARRGAAAVRNLMGHIHTVLRNQGIAPHHSCGRVDTPENRSPPTARLRYDDAAGDVAAPSSLRHAPATVAEEIV